MNICERLRIESTKANKHSPHKTILEFYNQNLELNESYHLDELDQKIRKYAAVFLELKLPFQSHVALLLENSSEFVFAFLGIISAGLVALPLSHLLSKDEVIHILKESQATFLLTEKATKINASKIIDVEVMYIDSFKQKIIDASFSHIEVEDQHAAFIVYTSGTTGSPRGVVHAHRVLEGRIPMLNGWTNIQEKDRVLHAGKLNWTYTLGVGLFDPLCQGATSLLYIGESDPNLWPMLLEKSKATIFATVPSLFRRIIKYNDLEKFDLSNLRHSLSAGEKLPNSIRGAWRTQTNTLIYEALGMSEISTYISNSVHIPIVEKATGSIQKGRKVKLLPLNGKSTVSVGIHEVGILSIHKDDPGLMLGYIQAGSKQFSIPSSMLREDWFLTGDLASIDKAGNIFYHGRNDDIINVSGYRINALEIESIIHDWEKCEEVAISTTTTEDGLELLVAWVVLSNLSPISQTTKVKKHDKKNIKLELKQFLEAKLAKYKQPHIYSFVNELPRNKNGKLQRNKLKYSSLNS